MEACRLDIQTCLCIWGWSRAQWHQLRSAWWLLFLGCLKLSGRVPWTRHADVCNERNKCCRHLHGQIFPQWLRNAYYCGWFPSMWCKRAALLRYVPWWWTLGQSARESLGEATWNICANWGWSSLLRSRPHHGCTFRKSSTRWHWEHGVILWYA